MRFKLTQKTIELNAKYNRQRAKEMIINNEGKRRELCDWWLEKNDGWKLKTLFGML